MTEVYVIGSNTAPDWCNKDLMQYIKQDGSTGYEFHGTKKTFILVPGDSLVLNNGRIDVRKKARK